MGVMRLRHKRRLRELRRQWEAVPVTKNWNLYLAMLLRQRWHPRQRRHWQRLLAWAMRIWPARGEAQWLRSPEAAGAALAEREYDFGLARSIARRKFAQRRYPVLASRKYLMLRCP